MLPESEEEAERRRLMRERKTVVLPVEVLDDPSLSPVEIVILAQILRFQSRIERFTVNGMDQFLNLSKNTIRKGLLKLTSSGYLIKDSRNNGWLIDSGKIYGNERENLPEQTVKSPEMNGKISLCKKEEESTKEEDKNNKQEYIYNNIILKETENEKEREIQEREKAEEVPEPEKPVEAEKPERFTAEYREIIDYLNMKTGKHYSARSRANQQHMSARLKEGRTVEDFKRVIDIKCFQWLDDPKMSQYLRPETLFSGKFDRYLNEEFKVTRKGPNGWEYTVTDEPDELDLIFGGGKHG